MTNTGKNNIEVVAATQTFDNKISKESNTYKAIVKAMHDETSRLIVPANVAATIVTALTLDAPSLEIVYSGGAGLDGVIASGSPEIGIGLVQQQHKGTNGKNVYVIKCALVYPAFSVAQIRESGDLGEAWLQKIVAKETAHVQFRGLRNAEDGERLSTIASRNPLTVTALVEQAERTRVDTEALAILWPAYRMFMKSSGKTKVLAFLPADKAIASVAKALRSSDWATRNTPELESRGLWADHIGPNLVAMAAQPIQFEDGTTMELDGSVIQAWLDSRDTFIIEAIVSAEPKDVSALDDFINGDDTDH